MKKRRRKVAPIRPDLIREHVAGDRWRLGETRHNCATCAKPIRWAMAVCSVCWKLHGVNEKLQ